MRSWCFLAILVSACGGNGGSAPRDGAAPADGAPRTADGPPRADGARSTDAPRAMDGRTAPDSAAMADRNLRDAPTGPDGGLAQPTWSPAAFAWPMAAHDVRRTGRSPFAGPQSYTAAAARNWTYAAQGAASINMQAVVTDRGVYFGSWGINRRAANSSPDSWIKGDGKYYGLSLDTGTELFTPLDPRPLPACYRYASRAPLTRDRSWCGATGDYVVSFFNGTIEGTALVDPDSGVQYVGRGDGGFYAIDPAGNELWRFATFNPVDRDDPDGGGEVIGGAVMGPGKILYFATWGAPGPEDPPIYETHAVYAVDTGGQLVWRYPSATARLESPFLAPPALSPDGRTLYVATWFADANQPGRLRALDLTAPPSATDAQRLRWELPLKNPARAGMPSLWVRHISVGADGTIYLGAAESRLLGTAAAVVAVKDEGGSARVAWLVEPQGYPNAAGYITQGLALWEENGVTRRIYAATGHPKDINATGGALFALDAMTGAVLATFDPALVPGSPGIGGMTAPTLGNDETVYVGIRGRHDLVQGPEVASSQWRNGWMYAVKRSGSAFDLRWKREVQGQLDWANPAIGANGGLYFGSTDSFSPLSQATFYGLAEQPAHHSPLFHAIFE